ncbi:MAG TPA: hypothetical protein VM146_00625 [Steroidobacteraceae bacterium]|nr:hypothetical protein [Steroidobacteraceae bacterium]
MTEPVSAKRGERGGNGRFRKADADHYSDVGRGEIQPGEMDSQKHADHSRRDGARENRHI